MKYRLPRSSAIMNILCLLLLLGMVVFLASGWSGFPERVPGHYNAAGEVDRWGSKVELLALPAVTALLYAGITVLEHFPQAWNTGVRVTPENRARVYAALARMIAGSKLCMVAVFCFLTVRSARAEPLPGWLLPVFLLGFFGLFAGSIVKLHRMK